MMGAAWPGAVMGAVIGAARIGGSCLPDQGYGAITGDSTPAASARPGEKGQA
ncbi:MAG TPA: hypothetical protein VF070_28715 [Streptosporangiaceae bacterium]